MLKLVNGFTSQRKSNMSDKGNGASRSKQRPAHSPRVSIRARLTAITSPKPGSCNGEQVLEHLLLEHLSTCYLLLVSPACELWGCTCPCFMSPFPHTHIHKYTYTHHVVPPKALPEASPMTLSMMQVSLKVSQGRTCQLCSSVFVIN